MDAVAAAPRLPTMAASIYCIAIDVSWARIAGRLSPRIRRTFWMLPRSCPARTISRFIFVLDFDFADVI
jgi:hypothetical protein